MPATPRNTRRRNNQNEEAPLLQGELVSNRAQSVKNFFKNIGIFFGSIIFFIMLIFGFILFLLGLVLVIVFLVQLLLCGYFPTWKTVNTFQC
jgi:hypothetical protein